MNRSDLNSIGKLQSSPSNARQRGSTLVEFAVVISVVLTMMFGVIDFSRAIYAYHWVSDAAREATRYASVRGSACTTYASACPAASGDVTNYIKGIVSSGIFVNASATAGNPGYLAVTTTWPGTGGSGGTCRTGAQPVNFPGCVVKVQVQYTYGFSLPYLTSLGHINMTSTSQFVISQ